MASNAAPPSPARNLRQNVNFAFAADRLQQCVLVNLAVDSHGQPFLEMRRELGIEFAEAAEKLADVRCLDLELGRAARELAKIADQGDVRHWFDFLETFGVPLVCTASAETRFKVTTPRPARPRP